LYESLKLKIPKNFVKVKYIKPTNDAHTIWYESFKEEKFLETMGKVVNDVFKFDKTLTLVLSDCGKINAFYNPADRTLTICYELLAEMSRFYAETIPDEVERGTKIGNALAFIFFHEVGHALIDLFKLPITSKEEDAADYFSFYLLGSNGVPEGVMACMEGANFFMDSYKQLVSDTAYIRLKKEGKEPSLPFWDEHSLDIQRFYSIAALLYGSDPDKYDYFIKDGLLGDRRPNNAISEYQKIKAGWDKILKPYIKWRK
jgi:Putative metallopeptidase